jgi:integrase
MRKNNLKNNNGLRSSAVSEVGKKKGWQSRLQELINANNTMKVSGRGSTSYATREVRARKLFLIFNTLTKELKFGLEDPVNLKVKHIECLVNHWIAEKKAAGTIEMYLSYLRVLCQWMNKSGMVKGLGEYAPGIKRVYAAQRDKSFTGNDVNFWDVWQKVYDMDSYVGMQMLLINAFGLRRKEAVMFQPVIADKETHIEVYDGTKGGRPRTVPINDDLKRGTLATVKNFIAKKCGRASGHIGHPDKTLLQNMKRYSYVMGACGISKKELGVTGHGLRAEYAIDQLIKRGLIPTIRGGTGQANSAFKTKAAALQVAAELGHNRCSVMTAYAGSWRIVMHKGEFVAIEDGPAGVATGTKKPSANPGQGDFSFDDV